MHVDNIRCKREIIKKLSKGIDPTTDRIFEEDTILNHPLVKRSLCDTVKYLDELIQIKNEGVPRKASFNLTSEQAKRIILPGDSITISHLVHIINEQHKDNRQKKLQATQITQWLYANDFLEIQTNPNGDLWKIPTEKGKSIGIQEIIKVNSSGKTYSANLYNKEAQHFILEKIVEITNESD
jgi:hypothetical protein